MWLSVDPLAEQAANWTPYRYGYNNPVNFTDPTGMLETQYKDEDEQTLLNTKDGSLETIQRFKGVQWKTILDTY